LPDLIEERIEGVGLLAHFCYSRRARKGSLVRIIDGPSLAGGASMDAGGGSGSGVDGGSGGRLVSRNSIRAKSLSTLSLMALAEPLPIPTSPMISPRMFAARLISTSPDLRLSKSLQERRLYTFKPCSMLAGLRLRVSSISRQRFSTSMRRAPSVCLTLLKIF